MPIERGRLTVAPNFISTKVTKGFVMRRRQFFGAAMASDWTVSAGTELETELPNGGGTVTARVVRSGGGELAVVFSAESQALARIDRALAALTQTRRAA